MTQVLLPNHGFEAQGLLDAARISMIRTDNIIRIPFVSANNAKIIPLLSVMCVLVYM